MATRRMFEGFDELSATLAAMTNPKETGKALAGAVRRALNEVKRDAQARIPVGIDPHRSYKGRLLAPGFARRSIRVIVKTHRSGQKASGVLGVRAEAFYAIQYVELGTVKMAARPWLRPAFLSHRDATVQSVGKGLEAWILDLAARRSAGAVRGNQRARTLLAGLSGVQ